VATVRETYELGMTGSLVARNHGVNPNQVFHWCKLERGGALTAVAVGRRWCHRSSWRQRDVCRRPRDDAESIAEVTTEIADLPSYSYNALKMLSPRMFKRHQPQLSGAGCPKI
jgi:transposase-like protein